MARRRPERIDIAIIGGRRAIRLDLLVHRRQQPQIRNQGANILFVPVGGVVPRHALPVQGLAVAADAAANRAADLSVAPLAEARLGMRRQVARPQRAHWLPTYFGAAAGIGAM